MHNYTMLEKLDILFDARLDGLPDHKKNRIMEYLLPLKASLRDIFKKPLMKTLIDFLRSPFRYFVKKLADECLDNFFGAY